MFSIIIAGAKSILGTVDDEQGCWPSVVGTSQHTSTSVHLMNHAELSGTYVATRSLALIYASWWKHTEQYAACSKVRMRRMLLSAP